MTSDPALAAGTATVVLVDRYLRRYSFTVPAGSRLSRVMLERHIPRDAVIGYLDGLAIDDERHVLAANSTVELRMVRAYQLPEFDKMLGLWNDPEVQNPTERTIYTKKALWFNDNGVCELRQRGMNPEQFVAWLEETFVQGILSKNLLASDVVLALSGGRDSVALLYLLDRCRDRLPRVKLHACTVTALANALDLEIAKEIAGRAGVRDYALVTSSDVENIFRLRVPYRQAIDTVFDEYGRAKSLYIVHHIMRTGVESYMRQSGVKTLCMGLHTEDLMAGVLWGTLLGWTFGESAAKKSWGPYQHIYPLWPITKKELTLYLELVGPPKHSAQTAPDHTDRGDHNRDLNYFVSDSLQTLWPGFPMHMFEGLEQRFERTRPEIEHRECPVCRGYFIPQRAKDPSDPVCHTCRVFRDLGLTGDTQ